MRGARNFVMFCIHFLLTFGPRVVHLELAIWHVFQGRAEILVWGTCCWSKCFWAGILCKYSYLYVRFIHTWYLVVSKLSFFYFSRNIWFFLVGAGKWSYSLVTTCSNYHCTLSLGGITNVFIFDTRKIEWFLGFDYDTHNLTWKWNW